MNQRIDRSLSNKCLFANCINSLQHQSNFQRHTEMLIKTVYFANILILVITCSIAVIVVLSLIPTFSPTVNIDGNIITKFEIYFELESIYSCAHSILVNHLFSGLPELQISQQQFHEWRSIVHNTNNSKRSYALHLS